MLRQIDAAMRRFGIRKENLLAAPSCSHHNGSFMPGYDGEK